MWNKSDVVTIENFTCSQTGSGKIISMLTYINHRTDEGEQYEGKEKSREKISQNIPVNLSHNNLAKVSFILFPTTWHSFLSIFSWQTHVEPLERHIGDYQTQAPTF